MKFVISLWLLLFASNLMATNLCDSACDSSISFPEGGFIEARKDAILIFGEGGFINNGTSTLSYPTGKRLKLDDHDEIEFDEGGLFNIGRGGNIDYKEIVISTDGVIELKAINGKKTIQFEKLKLDGDLVIKITSDIKILKGGNLEIKGGLIEVNQPESIINIGKVKGWFEFQDSVIHYLKNKKSYKKESKIAEILQKLEQGEVNIKEIDRVEYVTGRTYLNTKQAFILLPVIEDEPDQLEEPASPVVNTENTLENNAPNDIDAVSITTLEPEVATVDAAVTDSLQPTEGHLNSVSVASAGGCLNWLGILYSSGLISLRRSSAFVR